MPARPEDSRHLILKEHCPPQTLDAPAPLLETPRSSLGSLPEGPLQGTSLCARLGCPWLLSVSSCAVLDGTTSGCSPLAEQGSLEGASISSSSLCPQGAPAGATHRTGGLLDGHCLLGLAPPSSSEIVSCKQPLSYLGRGEGGGEGLAAEWRALAATGRRRAWEAGAWHRPAGHQEGMPAGRGARAGRDQSHTRSHSGPDPSEEQAREI